MLVNDRRVSLGCVAERETSSDKAKVSSLGNQRGDSAASPECRGQRNGAGRSLEGATGSAELAEMEFLMRTF